MTRQDEVIITGEIVRLLDKMTHGWKLAAEQRPFKNEQAKPDITATRNGYETIVIEAKNFDASSDSDETKIREKYFGTALKRKYRGASDESKVAMLLRYPKDVVETEGGNSLTQALLHTENLEYQLLTADGSGDFPKTGFARGSLKDIAMALAVGSSPADKIQAAAGVMLDALEDAGKDIADVVERKPGIGRKLSKILGEDVTEETCGKACLFIINSFIFQDAIATAGDERFEGVGALSQYHKPDAELTTEHIHEILEDWQAILRVNYVPIFKEARRILEEALWMDMPLTRRVMTNLLKTAVDIVESHLPQIHELAGEIFQELIVDRAYVKANYTLPESAALLSALVCPDIDVDNLPKVADFACGTGALVNGVYKQIRWLYEQKTGKSSREIHRQMMENNLGGSDIYPHATHLTFMVMASAYPEVTLGATRVVPAPYGEYGAGDYKIGSLELLDNQMFFDPMEVMSERVSGDTDEATAEIKREFPHGEMDIVIMNPPYLVDTADANSSQTKISFDAKGRSDAVRLGMNEVLGEKSTEFSTRKLKYSYFVELAHRKLRDGGRMGFVLPATIFAADGFKKVREMWATKYHNVIVVTIAQNSGHDSAFSADTNMTECLVVADKGVGENTGRATFVSLNERPKSLLSANKLARQILGNKLVRRLEDAPYGGDVMGIGDERVAQSLNCPISGEEWGAARTRSMSLQQSAYRLQQGELHLPLETRSTSIPMCRIGDFAVVGYDERQIKAPKSGAFSPHKTRSCSHEGYPAIWHVEAERQRAMLTQPNTELRMKVGKEERAQRILERNSRTHYHTSLRFNSNSQLSHWTDTPSVGVRSITNVRLEDSRYDAAWTLWTNSTLGLFCHWMTAGKQQSGRGMLRLGTLLNVPTLDVRELSEAQLAAAERVFADLKDARMLPYYRCADDAWRHVLDARLLSEVLGITDEATHRAMQTLREMLCAEPSIAGTSQKKHDLEKERVKFDIAGSAEGDAAALGAQRVELGVLGVWLPATSP